jgi:hypothetical protein
VRGGEDSRAGAVVFGCHVEFKHLGNYNGRGRGIEIWESLHTGKDRFCLEEHNRVCCSAPG